MEHYRIRIHEHGGPQVMRTEQATGPVAPGPGQVWLEHEAIGVNFVDTMFRDGTFRMPLPFDMGVEGAGVVRAVGEGVDWLAPGDRAGYFFSPGAYATGRLIDAHALVKLPDGISSQESAALLTKGLTAWMLVKRVFEVGPGSTVLVHGAAGGVGSLLARWAHALGATVIASVGSEAKMQAVRDAGIEHVLLASDPMFVTRVGEITGGAGVDVVYEFVGKATFALSVAALREGGTLAHVGNASGSPTAQDKALLEGRAIRYVQPATSQYVGERDSLEHASTDVFDAYRKGTFGTLAPRRYPLRDAARAHEDIAARRLVGPAILVP